MIGFKKPEAKIWSFIIETAKTNVDMDNLCQTVSKMNNLK